MPFRKKGKSQVRRSGQLRYHQIKWASSLVAVPNDLPLPPAVTHTHTMLQAPVCRIKVFRKRNLKPKPRHHAMSQSPRSICPGAWLAAVLPKNLTFHCHAVRLASHVLKDKGVLKWPQMLQTCGCRVLGSCLNLRSLHQPTSRSKMQQF